MNYNIPFMFEKNIGQYEKKVGFLLKEKECIMFFRTSSIELYFDSKINKSEKKYKKSMVEMVLENSNKNSLIIGKDRFRCNLNYLKGNSQENWISNIPIYEKIKYREIYKGIDLIFYENKRKLEYDFIVKPKGDVNCIKIKFNGGEYICLDDNGNLCIKINNNTLKILKPKAYQYLDGSKSYINCNFIINDNTVGFEIDKYDKNKNIIIDPVLEYSTYLGGNGNLGSEYTTGKSIAVDENQCAYITGETNATIKFPITDNGYKKLMEDNLFDAYLIKIDTTKSGKDSLVYASYIGGDDGNEYGYGIKVCKNRYAYIVGQTSSNDFPIMKNPCKGYKSGAIDAFLVKIDTQALEAKESLLYSTYLGGEGNDYAYGVEIDSSELVYIVGTTTSKYFNITNQAYQTILQGEKDSFFIKLDTSKSGEAALLYGTYLGGNNKTGANSIALDSENNVYIVGETSSTINFPITENAYEKIIKGTNNSYIIKINPLFSGKDSLVYGSYIGGSSDDIAHSVAIDSNNYVYIVGHTTSIDFPVTDTGYEKTIQGDLDAFFIKMDLTSGNEKSLIYGTYIGGTITNSDLLRSIAYSVVADERQCVYIVGSTTVLNFPVSDDAFQKDIFGRNSAFFLKIDTTLSNKRSLIYGTYLGGSGSDIAYSMAIDKNKNAYITGQTTSLANFPLTDNAYNTTLLSGFGVAFLIKLNLKEIYFTNLILKEYACECSAKVGEKIYFKLKLKNYGPYNAENIVVTDEIHNAFDIISFKASSGEINKDQNILTWTIPDLLAEDNSLAIIEVLANGTVYDSFIQNKISLVSDTKISNLNLVSDKEKIYIETEKSKNCDLVVEISSYKNDDTSYEIIYRINLINNGPNDAVNVLAKDIFDSRVNVISYKSLVGSISYNENILEWNIQTLKVGEKVTATIVSNYSEIDFLINTVTVTSDTEIVNVASCTDTVIDYVNYSRV